MRILKTIPILFLGVVLGTAGHIAWQSLLNPVTASGVLQLEPQSHPAVSASYPAGFFVESRVYVETAAPDLLGQTVIAWGGLSLATDPDAPSYPKIKNTELTVVK